MIRDKYSTRITVDGRLFQIYFWNDISLGTNFPYYSVEEIETRWRKKFFLFGDYIEYEIHIPICTYWTDESRVEHAKAHIRNYLDKKQKEYDELCEVANFCKNKI